MGPFRKTWRSSHTTQCSFSTGIRCSANSIVCGEPRRGNEGGCQGRDAHGQPKPLSSGGVRGSYLHEEAAVSDGNAFGTIWL